MRSELFDPWDVALGAAVRRRRRGLKVTQTALGEAVGVTFQQIQKYELGSNRVSFSALVRISEALQCSPYQLIESVVPPEPVSWKEGEAASFITPQQQELIQAFDGIRSPRIRQAVLEMIEKMSGGGEK